MKRSSRTIIMIAAFIGAGLAGVYTVQAAKDTNGVITDQQISTIRSRCSDIQATLNRIHESDKVLRVNKGYEYKAIMLDKLMTPLNQRIAINQIDGGKLGKIAAEFSQTFGKFDKAYSLYERDLSAAINIDCTKQPTAFYDQILLAYASRQDLQVVDSELISLAKQFKVEAVAVFKAVDKEKSE